MGAPFGVMGWSELTGNGERPAEQKRPALHAADFGRRGGNRCGGEQPLHPYHACNLGSLNLGRYWDAKKGKVKFGELYRDARVALRGLNDVIETSQYPTPKIQEAVLNSLMVGLGVKGLADLLIEAELPYDSDAARKLAKRCLKTIRWATIAESKQLAQERGVFPLWEGTPWAEKGIRVRNAAMTTVAPTGTISGLVDASGGVEPIFAVAYARKTNEGQVLRYIHPKFVEVARREGFYSEELMDRVAASGTVVGVEGVPEKWQQVFKGAHDIHWKDHIAMQAMLQEEVHNAISKTVNLPHDAAKEEVAKAYILAWKSGCKGITVFRDGCRSEQVLTTGQAAQKTTPPASQIEELVAQVAALDEETKEKFFSLLFRKVDGYTAGRFGKLRPVKVPPVLNAQKIEKETSMGELRVFITTLPDGRPIELDARMGHSGSEVSAACEAIGRLGSVLLRVGVDPWWVVKQLQGIGGPQPYGFGPDRVLSLPDGIGRALADYLRMWEQKDQNGYVLENGSGHAAINEVSFDEPEEMLSLDICPSCHNATLVHEDGCKHCVNPACSYTAC